MSPSSVSAPQKRPDRRDNSARTRAKPFNVLENISRHGVYAMPLRLKQAGTVSSRAVLLVGLGLALLAAHAAPAAAEDDDDDDLSFEQKIIRNILNPGGTGGGIEYRERSPLVIPPARNLPPPEADAAKPAANWPADADQKTKTAKKKKGPLNARETLLWNDPGKALTPDEMRQGRTASSPNSVTGPGQGVPDRDPGNPVLPSVLGYTGGVFGSLWGGGNNTETATFTAEPPRTTLTAPPAGYMTPSPNQPYGLGTQKFEPAKPMNPMDLPARSR